MIVFADSSAVVTGYAPAEADAVPAVAGVVVSALARVEVVSALWRKFEINELTVAEASDLVRAFEADWLGGRFHIVELRADVLFRAATLTAAQRLRSLDAIQLACALAARDADPECRSMVVLDERLRRAAAAERFAILPV